MGTNILCLSPVEPIDIQVSKAVTNTMGSPLQPESNTPLLKISNIYVTDMEKSSWYSTGNFTVACYHSLSWKVLYMLWEEKETRLKNAN